MAGSGKIHGKQIKDNSLKLNKLSDGEKILSNQSLLGIDKNPNEFLNNDEYVNKEYVDNFLDQKLENVVEDLTPELGGDLDTGGFNISSTSGDLLIENISYPKIDGTDGQVMITDGNGNLSFQNTKDPFYMQFSLSESINNANEFFFSWRARGTNSGNAFKSNRNNGLSQVCSPIMIPYDITIKSATLVIKSSGVNNATVTFPVMYKTKFYVVGFNDAQDPTINGGVPYDVDFPIESGSNVGTFNSLDTEQIISLDNLNIDVDRGRMVGLEFEAGTGASEIAISEMAFVSFDCIKR